MTLKLIQKQRGWSLRWKLVVLINGESLTHKPEETLQIWIRIICASHYFMETAGKSQLKKRRMRRNYMMSKMKGWINTWINTNDDLLFMSTCKRPIHHLFGSDWFGSARFHLCHGTDRKWKVMTFGDISWCHCHNGKQRRRTGSGVFYVSDLWPRSWTHFGFICLVVVYLLCSAQLNIVSSVQMNGAHNQRWVAL